MGTGVGPEWGWGREWAGAPAWGSVRGRGPGEEWRRGGTASELTDRSDRGAGRAAHVAETEDRGALKRVAGAGTPRAAGWCRTEGEGVGGGRSDQQEPPEAPVMLNSDWLTLTVVPFTVSRPPMAGGSAIKVALLRVTTSGRIGAIVVTTDLDPSPGGGRIRTSGGGIDLSTGDGDGDAVQRNGAPVQHPLARRREEVTVRSGILAAANGFSSIKPPRPAGSVVEAVIKLPPIAIFSATI